MMKRKPKAISEPAPEPAFEPVSEPTPEPVERPESRAKAILEAAQATNFNDTTAYIISAADRDTLLKLLA